MRRHTARLTALIAAIMTIAALAPNTSLAPVSALAAAGWTQVQASNAPLARAGAAVTFDSGRGVVVVFGGWDGQRVSPDTWEYDGTSWVKRVSTNPPPARLGAVMAYDRGLGKSILFGGIGGGDLSDTWGWDGHTWTRLQSVNRPSARAFAGLAPSAGGHLVLFGGAQRGCDGDGDSGDDGDCGSAFASDTWEWDGSSWNQKSPATSPGPRGMVSLAYAADRGHTVLFGGLSASGVKADTWEYDGVTWKQVASSGPAARAAYGLSYDSARNRAVLQGGCGGGTSVDGTTWEWDGSSWAAQTSYGNPGARTGSAQAYDSRRARTVLMGGVPGASCEHFQPPIGDTWGLQVPVPGAVTGLNVTADEGSIPAGASAVRLSDLPARRINAMVQAPAVKPYGTTPIGGTQFGGIQFGGIQFGGIQFGGIDLGSTQFGGIQFGGIQFGGIVDNASRIPSGGNSLANVRLSSIPAVDWTAVLKGSALEGQLLQALTLQQVLADSVAGPRLQQLTLAQTRLNKGLLSTVPVADLLAGTGALDNIPVPVGYADWCSYLKSTPWAPAQSCSDSAQGGVVGASVDPSRNSLLGLDIAGADTSGIQFGGIQFGGIGNLAQTPVASFNLAAMPSLAATQFGGIPVSTIPTPSRVVDCSRVDCSSTSTATLADAASMSPSAILPSAKIIDLGTALNGVRVGDVVAGLLPLHDLAWEKLSADGLQDVTSVTPAGVHYHVTFDVPCNGADIHLGVQASLAKGFRYMPGTSTVSVASAPAQALSDPAGSNPPLTDTPDNLSWTSFPQVACQGLVAGSQHWVINFQAQPSLDLGVATVSAMVTTPAPASVTGAAPVRVTRNWTNSDPSNAPVIAADTLVLGHVASAGDVNYFRFPVPAEGSQVSFHLSHMDPGADYDLTVARPHVSSLLSSQFGGIQFGGIPLGDPGAGSNNRDASLAPETLQDVQFGGIPVGAQFGGIDIAAVSQTRGNADELARITTGAETGYYTVAISGYNGSSSPRPFELRVKVVAPPQLPPCPARPSMTGPATGTLVPVAAVPSTTRTLFLVDQQRLSALYPAADATALQAALASVASRTEVAGQVLNIDGDSSVHAAYDAWDASPCSIDAANNVVRQVNALVAKYRAQAPGIRYIVNIGSDEVIPMARVADSTSISNERDYSRDLAFLLQQGGNQQAGALYAAAALGFYLSDDAYTTFTSTPFDGRELYLPTISGGRLVETAKEMTDQLNAYVSSGGVLNPTTAVTTGYDFLSDGASSIQASLAKRLGAGADGSLIGDTWTKQDLLGKLVPASGAASPGVIDANAHYNHYQLEPAAAFKNGTYTANDIVSNGDLPQRTAGSGSPAQFAGRVLFTMGCHGGLNVADSLLAAPTADQVTRLRDWTQYYSQQMAAVYVANSGYGYGDTDTVGLSERLMSLFAQKFADDSLAVGDKLVMAKHAYFDNGAVYDVYDSKVLEEATLYGLPFYHLGGSGTGTKPVAVTPSTDPVSGVATANFPVTPKLTVHDTARGRFWSDDNGGVQASLYRPIIPSVSRDVTASGGLVAHGAIIKSLVTGDQSGVTPALDTPTVDLAAHEPQPNFVDVNFPANLVHVSRSNSFGNDHQSLVVNEAQYRGQGVERLVSGGSVDVAYSSSSDTAAPGISLVGVTRNGTSATITVNAHKATGTLMRVAALYNDAGTWHFVDLTSVGGDTWSKVVVLSTAEDFEVLAQAEDGAGNVGYSTNKGDNFHSVPSAPGAPQNLTAAGGKHQVTLQWQAPRAGSVTSYQVYRGTSPSNLAPLAMVAGSLTGYADQGLPNGATYTYGVSAVSESGEGVLSNLASATTDAGITPPQNLTASGGNVGEVVLNWAAPQNTGGSSLSRYNIYRNDGTGFRVVHTVSAPQTSFTDTNLQVLSNYVYYVTAVNAGGEESSPSNSVCARPAPLGGILSCTGA